MSPVEVVVSSKGLLLFNATAQRAFFKRNEMTQTTTNPLGLPFFYVKTLNETEGLGFSFSSLTFSNIYSQECALVVVVVVIAPFTFKARGRLQRRLLQKKKKTKILHVPVPFRGCYYYVLLHREEEENELKSSSASASSSFPLFFSRKKGEVQRST